MAPIMKSRAIKSKVSIERSSAKKNSYNEMGSLSQKMIKSSFNDKLMDND